MGIAFEWDENKRRRNLERHGVDFADILPLFGQEAIIFEDDRKDYGERRYILLGELHGQFFQVAFTVRETRVRLISARRGNQRERRIYEQEKREAD
jgi:uncharacterized DUF497 family protein